MDDIAKTYMYYLNNLSYALSDFLMIYKQIVNLLDKSKNCINL